MRSRNASTQRDIALRAQGATVKDTDIRKVREQHSRGREAGANHVCNGVSHLNAEGYTKYTSQHLGWPRRHQATTRIHKFDGEILPARKFGGASAKLSRASPKTETCTSAACTISCIIVAFFLSASRVLHCPVYPHHCYMSCTVLALAACAFLAYLSFLTPTCTLILIESNDVT